MLHDLVKLESRPKWLTGTAYKWCSVICESQSSEGRERLLLDSLKVGFRHLDSQGYWFPDLHLTHTDYHRALVDVVFKSENSEAIADLLRAWTVENEVRKPAHTLLGLCVGHLVDLHNLVPFSSSLRQLVIRSVGIIGYERFEEVGVERFAELLNRLRVDTEDLELRFRPIWASLLLDTI